MNQDSTTGGSTKSTVDKIKTDTIEPITQNSDITITMITLLHTAHLDNEPVFHATHVTQSIDHRNYGYSSDAEIFGILEGGVISFCPRKEPDGNRLYKSHFCDYLKKGGLPTAFEKSRYVAMPFNDRKKGLLT